MSEPEEVILEAAHAAIAHLPRRRRPAQATDAEPFGLDGIHRRLELFLSALAPSAPPIVPAEAPAMPTWLGRMMRRTPAHRLDPRAFPSTDGHRLRLPRRIDSLALDGRTLESYLVIGLELALRAERRSPAVLPVSTSPAVQDLFAIAEARATGTILRRRAPGLCGTVTRLRRLMLQERPGSECLTAAERRVEILVRETLEGEGSTVEEGTAPASVAWARERARDWDLETVDYRGLPPVFAWGLIHAMPPGERTSQEVAQEPEPSRTASRRRTAALPRSPVVREAAEGEDDEGPGIASIPNQDLQESAEDPMGLQRPTDRDDSADPGGLADSVSELPELRVVSDQRPAYEVLVSDDPPHGRALRVSEPVTASATTYPEWDWRARRYRIPGAIVREGDRTLGPDAWWREVFHRHARLMRHTRRRFERLRARPQRFSRQLEGDELDMLAWVESWVSSRAGGPTEDRIYREIRFRRRDLALALLIDTSASTDAWVGGRSRIVDVEKEALLVVQEGLDALGDRYAILAFAGESSHDVRVTTVKGFDEPNGIGVRRAIAGLEPDGYTRLGAAIRHTAALLLRQAARDRLMLVLSDGKPNDVDDYEGRYGVEDAAMAVRESRQDGLATFCLTVDRECAAYLPRIFGSRGFALLPHATRLPGALATILEHLIVR